MNENYPLNNLLRNRIAAKITIGLNETIYKKMRWKCHLKLTLKWRILFGASVTCFVVLTKETNIAKSSYLSRTCVDLTVCSNQTKKPFWKSTGR